MRVSPREIADYVDRAARVGGCDPSDAGLLAGSVVFAEIHAGGGIDAFLAGPPASDLAAAIRSFDIAALAVLEDRDASPVEHVLASRVPRSLLALAVDGWRRHGIATNLGAFGLVDRVRVWSTDPEERSDEQRGEYRTALAEGVDVDADSWARVTSIAADFLASEAVLDELST